jgi:hypothetical protein
MARGGMIFIVIRCTQGASGPRARMLPREAPEWQAVAESAFRPHCLTVDHLGVQVALDTGSSDNLARWLEKMEVTRMYTATAVGPGSTDWQNAGLTPELVPRLRTLLHCLDVPEFREQQQE